jgi:2'-5' RNA ligase
VTPEQPPTFAPVITGIVLLVPEAASIVSSAHITLLAPFGKENEPTPGEITDVAEFFADHAPFDYQLSTESRFPDGVRYLGPEPANRFSRLTHALHRLFPEYPPYGGAYDLVVPHLTIPDDANVPPLPIHAHAREACLLHYEDGVYTELDVFPFGASAA